MDNNQHDTTDNTTNAVLQSVLEKDAEREKTRRELALLVQPKGRPRASVWTRIEQHLRFEGDCRLWTGSITSGGPIIGMYVKDDMWRMVAVRKLIYEDEIGPLPPGTRFRLEAACGNPRCVAPHHQQFATINHVNQARLSHNLDALQAQRQKLVLRLEQLDAHIMKVQRELEDFEIASDT